MQSTADDSSSLKKHRRLLISSTGMGFRRLSTQERPSKQKLGSKRRSVNRIRASTPKRQQEDKPQFGSSQTAKGSAVVNATVSVFL